MAQYENQASANPGLRVTETPEPNVFIGYHREWAPGSHTLLLAGDSRTRWRFRIPTPSRC